MHTYNYRTKTFFCGKGGLCNSRVSQKVVTLPISMTFCDSHRSTSCEHGKIKNSKIKRWRMELGCYDYDIMYRPRKNNIPANTLSRAQCNALNNMGRLHEIHENLCHPGITKLAHFVKVRNIPYSIEEVKRVCAACAVCARWKHTLLALASRILKESQWETVLPEVLHSITSLLCTITNATPHERLFSYQRQTPSGHSLPTWLSSPRPVLFRRHVRASKY